FPCSNASPAGEYGGWWSLTPLGHDKTRYRRSVGVCPSWNDFSMHIECTLKKGTAVIVGETESADCKPGPHDCSSPHAAFTTFLPRNSSHQVFINTRSADRGKY